MTPLKQEPIASHEKPLMDRVEDAMLPLINLVFLLLMFFILAGRLTDDPLPPLPMSQGTEGGEQPSVDLIVTGPDQWRINGDPVSADQLTQHLAVSPGERPLRIGANRDLSMASLERLFRRLEQAGYETVTVLTEPAS
ncbi:outer membrane transport energization protein ExbD [Tamilnaduibacter salinus]|uniref:Biopolymer transporter ExbD n=1 Tax=Tamilnaduibacter salinus TaxID=1484056 RepID=A0A2A2I0A4_9GAMM|nr:biopolymer transporter ExbD [Tamilnaduibacter salinus]PAV25139.1 biopolymer transporter ExbD [Tamilnaduibacter salinus]PVY76773.1 outer membrane transport energization protein ExbD [Tamilnaduibacter salinus]